VPIGARPGHLRRIIAALSTAQLEVATKHAELPAVLRRADALCKRRTQVIVLADLLDPDADAVITAARSLRARGHDPALVQILHHDERTLPFQELAWYESADSDARVLADPRGVRTAYLDELARLTAHFRTSLAVSRIPFASLTTSQDAVDAVGQLLRSPLARAGRSAA